MIILGIESSCDETAAAVLSVDDGGNMTALSNVVNSQIAIHRLHISRNKVKAQKEILYLPYI